MSNNWDSFSYLWYVKLEKKTKNNWLKRIYELFIFKKQLDKINNDELIGKKTNEIIENDSINNSERKNKTYSQKNNLKNELAKIINIENNYYLYLCKKYSDNYRFIKEVAIPQSHLSFDIVGESLNNSCDEIYELKIWNNIPNDDLIMKVIEKLIDSVEMYSRWKKIDCKCYFVIFTGKEKIQKMQKKLSTITNNNYLRLHICVYDLNEFIKDNNI